MARYFDLFPKVYNTQNNVTRIVTDILSRVSEIDTYKDNTLVYYSYDVQDGDTPESVADRYYDDPEKHWIILYTNDMIDPFFDWPLTTQQFNSYIEDKYAALGANTSQTGTAYAQSTIQEYYKTVRTVDGDTGNTTTRTYVVDHTTYLSIIPSSTTLALPTGTTISEYVDKSFISIYDYEVAANEAKRSIKLLNKDYAAQIFNELKSLMSK